MTPWLDDGDVRLYHGDALERLREMPSESVQMIVTSPPFWGLRDYGTGAWSGGDEGCDHVKPSPERIDALTRSSGLGGGPNPNNHDYHRGQYANACGKCGARRVDQQIGLEETPDEWCAKLVAVMREARRVLRSDGVCWIEVGDTYNSGSQNNHGRSTGLHDAERYSEATPDAWGGHRAMLAGLKPKDLVGAPWLLAFALRADGWYLRAEQIWHKVNPMPESVTDRPTRGHSTVFLLSKSARYFFDADSIREGEGSGRNARSVWSLASEPVSARALGCDTYYKASPDCSTHGLAADPQSWEQAARGEHTGEARLHRIDSTRARHALAQQAELASTPLRISETRSSATPHSTQSRRTGLAQSTSAPCTPSDETTPRTAGTLETPESAELHASTAASSNGSDGSLEGAPSAGMPSRTARKCSCEKHTVDHFATFPQALVERCILAGTSEHGACSECGAPWRRITEVIDKGRGVVGYTPSDDRHPRGTQRSGPGSGALSVIRAMLGWEPSCDHDAPVTPCLVMDVFMGSGTTALVARRLGRHAIGIELNLDYLAISATRLEQLSLLA